jgi:hypothetical protein
MVPDVLAILARIMGACLRIPVPGGTQSDNNGLNFMLWCQFSAWVNASGSSNNFLTLFQGAFGEHSTRLAPPENFDFGGIS